MPKEPRRRHSWNRKPTNRTWGRCLECGLEAIRHGVGYVLRYAVEGRNESETHSLGMPGCTGREGADS